MTESEWLERTLAAAPPLTPARIAALRAIFLAATPQNAAPAATGDRARTTATSS